jgi:hypothetical protein
VHDHFLAGARRRAGPDGSANARSDRRADRTADREADARADSGTCRGAAGRIRIGAGDTRHGDQSRDSRRGEKSLTHGFISLWFEWFAVNCVPNAEAKRVVPPMIVSEPLDERPKFQFG